MKFPASVLASLFLFVAETIAALYLSSTYRSDGDRMWQALTLLFSLMPCALVQFTLLFVHRDLSRDRPLVLLMHLLQLGPLYRCFEVFCLYCQSNQNEEPYVSITKKRQMPKNGLSEEVEKEVGQAEGKLFTHRSAFSRASVIQAFLGSAPQLTLQLYITVLQQSITTGRGTMARKRRRRNISRSTRAELQFPVSRVDRFLREGNYSRRLSSSAPVFLAGVLEYLISNILELAGEEAHTSGKKLISPDHVYQVVQNNQQLNHLFKEDTRSVDETDED
ncbi:hypothetical protein A6R68_01811 [Neotoma lepida]|uniref:Multifunctional fusion protein n=1 Tax=Neotoma lepida TaxID=56216 RepID=A0A1A6GTJ1_NEOLE|nr:hypothetical protein A6R68_01811 [Neotoma lepida]